MIAVLSDIHDNIPNLNTALTIAKENKVSALFVLGDITNADTLKFLATNFSEPIYLVSGNMEVCDLGTESKKYPQINFLGRHGGIIKIGNKVVGLCHEPNLIDGLISSVIPAKAGIQTVGSSDNRLDSGLRRNDREKPSIIFYGHTHKPFEELKNRVKLINPGNLANVFYAPTFALWDEQTDKLELKIL